MKERPLSEKIADFEGGEYYITAAIWRTGPYNSETFEIGIRHKATGKFNLLQGDFNHQSVQEVAGAIAHLLSMPPITGEHYTPEWCIEHFK